MRSKETLCEIAYITAEGGGGWETEVEGDKINVSNVGREEEKQIDKGRESERDMQRVREWER